MRGLAMSRWMTRLSRCCAAATGLVLALAPGAQAAWFGAGSVPGLGFDARVLASSVPGQVVVTGADSDDAVTGAAHAPGTVAFGAPFAVAPANEDAPAQVGAGGAVALQQGSRAAVRRLRTDGTVGPVTALPSPQATIGTPALAPSGALLVAAADAGGNLRLWRQSAEGAALTPIGAVLGHSDEGEATIAASGDDSFVAAFTTTDGNQTTLFAVRVTGTTVASPRELDQLTGDPNELFFSALALAPGGQFVVFQSSRQAGEFVRAANVDINSSATDLAGPFDEDAGVTTPPQAIPIGLGGAAVTWGQTDGQSVISPYALIADNATLVCSVAEPFTEAALVDRGGPQLVGVAATGTLGTAPVAAGCPAGAVEPGPSVGAAKVVGADVDADGALVVVAGSTDDNDVSTGTIVVDDASPPTLTDLSVPATVNENTPFDVSVSATDAWGVGDVSWSIDNTAVATGARATLPGVAAGEHTVTATVHNTAGLATSAQAAVSTPSAVGLSPPPQAPAPAPAAPPVVGQSSPPQLTLTGLTLDTRCVRYGDRRPPQGTLGFRFELSETATVTLTIQRRLGSRVRSRCPQDPLPRGTPGQLSKPVLASDLVAGPGPGTVTAGPNGHLLQAGAATTRRVRPVARRLPAGRVGLKIRAASTTLTAGTYLATLSAHTTDGRRATAGRIKFWVLK